MLDLAQAYFRFADEDDDHPLEEFLCEAERESGGDESRWIAKIREAGNVEEFHLPEEIF